MPLFGSKEKTKSLVLVDISSSSVGAAYARTTPNGPTVLVHSVRAPIAASSTDISTELMLRTLDGVLRDLRQNGAPALHKLSGSGSVQGVFVLVGAPWQNTEIHIETLVEEKLFTITETLLLEAKKKIKTPEGYYRSEESILGSVLNGYETPEPVGKRAKRAEIIVLSATIKEETAKLLRSTLGTFSSLHAVNFTELPSLIARAAKTVFPHEKDYLALRVSGEATELVLVKHGFPIFIATVPTGLDAFRHAAQENGFSSFPDGGDSIDRTKSVGLDIKLADTERRWVSALITHLSTFTEKHALPRTVFLITEEHAGAFLRRVLDAPDMHALWLSDEPLAVIRLESKQFNTNVVYAHEDSDDVVLSMLGLLS
jgi:hypothetical protein